MKKQRCKRRTKEQRAFRRRQTLRILLALFFLSVAGMAYAAIEVFQMDAWNKLDMSRILSVDLTLRIYDGDGAEISDLHAEEDRICVSLSEIPRHVQKAFISAEDARFYQHFGIDLIRIAGAAWADIKAGAYVQGASTISQQLIKLSHLSSEKEMSRKLEEAVLAYQLETLYSKDEILEMYLNYVYFGGGYYGIEAAARGYFGVSASELTLAQGALLAGILKSPSRFAPHIDPEASVGRRNVVLSLMLEYGYIDDAECQAAQAEELTLTRGKVPEKRSYYVDLALLEACGIFDMSMDELLRSGYHIHTGLDSELQTRCEEVLADDAYFPEDCENVQAAVVVMDTQSALVTALMGGRQEGDALSYNRAVRIRRQPGSVIKPILVYAPALEAGYTAATMLIDEEADFDGYKPSNSGEKYAGWVTMREAVTRSLNIPAVTVLSQLGVQSCKTFASRLGIEFDVHDTSLALALGGFTYGVSPYQIAAAYAAFANGGNYAAPALIQSVTDANGNELYRYEPQRVRVMREANAYILTSMLESVIQSGTGKRLGELDIPLAGKTGTTGDEDGNRDLWMAAYNPCYSACAWIGFDDNGDGVMPVKAAGGRYPALILKELFTELYPTGVAPDFIMPDDVLEYRLDSYTLENDHVAVLASEQTPLQGTLFEVFALGSAPEGMTSYWIVPQPPKELSIAMMGSVPYICFEAVDSFILYRLYRTGNDGASQLIGEFQGSNGTVRFADKSAVAGETYAYYVIPVHPQMKIDGEGVTGEASKSAVVTIPKAAWLSE